MLNDNKFPFLNIGIIGLGLIGGSLAKAIKRLYKNANIVAYDQENTIVRRAILDEVIDSQCDMSFTSLRSCDLVILATPVTSSISLLKRIKSHLKPTCIITDVCSTKVDLLYAIIEENLESRYIGGNPMVGSEAFGYSNSSADIFIHKYYLLTPSSSIDIHWIEVMKQFIRDIGSIPYEIDSVSHDIITASISHLPHIAASGLVNVLRKTQGNMSVKELTESSFIDTTRIASSSPNTWQQICVSNRSQIQKTLQLYIDELNNFKKSLDSADCMAIYNYFDDAKIYRDTIL